MDLRASMELPPAGAGGSGSSRSGDARSRRPP
jgi:hypothetical protein